MKHTNRWREGRKDTRKRKLESLSLIKKQFKNTKEYTKMNELIKLYMDSHDLVTTIGLEIAMLVDKEESKGC